MFFKSKEKEQRTPLKEGDYAPEFTLTTDGGGNITLSELKGKNVVLYFYPKDDTPGCTQEAKDFSCLVDKFEDENAVIVGVSKDDPDSHDKFKEKYGIPYALASDIREMVCDAYDCWVEKNMYGKKYMGVQRDTFLIGSDGKILKVWRKVKVEGHAEEVLQAVKELG